jgi:hypothetical protein
MPRRIKVPIALKEQLLLECGLRCPVPRCIHDVALEIHHIDGDRSNNAPVNLIVLCAVHHTLATSGKLSKNMCHALKGLLLDSFPASGTRVTRIGSRAEYLSAAIGALRETSLRYRSVYVGPLFAHPTWYHRRRDQISGLPNYDVEVREYIRRVPLRRRSETRFILRNVGRYHAKVDQLVHPQERSRFKRELDAEILAIWQRTGSKGPLVCCVDTGFLRIPLIHDTSCIIGSRDSEANQIQGGYLFKEQAAVERELTTYDAVFDASYRGQRTEVEALRSFVASLWQ